MRKICRLAVLVAFSAACGAAPPVPEAIQTATPAASGDRPIFIYLHGAIIETQGPRPTHPEHGTYEYQQILDSLSARGLEVRSEVRSANADVEQWAERTAGQVRELIAGGTDPGMITVAGFSKGGGIALRVADLVDEPEVGYVIIAACGEWIPAEWVPKGRLLSIREESDNPRIQACQSVFDRTPDPSRHREVVLSLGGGHRAFYTPQAEWVDLVVAFAQRSTAGR